MQVYLVGRQFLDEIALDNFYSDNNITTESDSDVPEEVLVETAGRLCYMSFNSPRPGGNKAYIKHLIEVGHTSVLEHAVYNFIIAGVSRSLTHELVRHRVGMSFSQLSQRYVDESDTTFICPDVIKDDAEIFEWWNESVKKSLDTYNAITKKLLAICKDRKLARQAARSVLPNATETKVFLTGNARALRHFITLRGSPAADVEIRDLARLLLSKLVAESPNIFGDLTVYGTD